MIAFKVLPGWTFQPGSVLKSNNSILITMKSVKTINKIILGLFIFTTQMNFGQTEVAEKSFKDGYYITFDDFKALQATGQSSDYVIKAGGDGNSYRFFDAQTDKKMKKQFAFYDESGLYVNTGQMVKLLGKEDKGQSPDGMNYYLKAQEIGKRYIYFEDHFVSNSAGMWGGMIATAAARRVKGIVYDRENHSFNLFKNAKDFEEFIQNNHPELMAQVMQVQENEKRKKKVEDIDLIRKLILEINKA